MMRIAVERVLAAFFAIGAACAWIGARLLTSHGVPESPLQALYVQGFSGTLQEASVIMLVTAVLYGAYAFYRDFQRAVDNTAWSIGAYLRASSPARYAIIACAITAVFLFLLNSWGILYGTFLIDDYKMYAIVTERSAWQLFWTPINDHVIPLFWLELKTLFFFTGAHPALLNFPLFVPAIIAIGGAAVLLRMLGFGPSTLFVLLSTFASTTIVSHQLYGFYAIAPYFQVLALFILSLIFFVQAKQSLRFTYAYLILSLTLLAMAIFLESGGVWTPIAYALFVCTFHRLRVSTWDIRALLRTHVWELVAAAGITLSYAVYLVMLPHYTPESFYGFNRLPLSFDTIRELYNVLTAGTLLSLFAPRLGLIVSQPRLAALIMPWHIGMFLLFCAFVIFIMYALRKGTVGARILVPYFTLLTLGTSLLVAIARPSSNPAAFYRDQNLLFPLFFLTLALAVFAHEWIRSAASEEKRRARTALTIAFLVLVLVAQHLFSFYKEQYRDDTTFNQSFTAHLRDTLTPALNELSSSASMPLAVPSLGALFLNGGFHQLPELSAFSSFIGVRNVEWLSFNQGPYLASTSPAFITALKSDDRLREWYLANGEVGEHCNTKTFGKNDVPAITNTPVRLAGSLDPALAHTLYFDLHAADAPATIFIDLAFKNDFNATGTRAYIRIDQYTKTATTSERRYVCSVDLNEIPAYALSGRVSNFNLTVTTPGEYHFRDFRVDQR